MPSRTMPALIWVPRILGIAYALFLALFAFDVFGEGHGFWQTALDLVMHLVPTLVVLATVLLAWRWPFLGGVLFSALGVLYFFLFRGRFPWTTYALMTGPLFLTGLLFLISSLMTRRLPMPSA